MTPMKAGSGPGGGGVLFPVSALQVAPQLGALGLSAKPLKESGAGPPLREFNLAHWAPQNVTELPTTAFLSPIAKLPPPGAKAKTSVLHEVEAVLPPTSLMFVVIVKVPVDA
jgi:hypothetical protein